MLVPIVDPRFKDGTYQRILTHGRVKAIDKRGDQVFVDPGIGAWRAGTWLLAWRGPLSTAAIRCITLIS